MPPINYQLSNRRWWKSPGERIWEDDLDGGRWRAIFDCDENDGFWNIIVENLKDSSATRIQLFWDHSTRDLIDSDRILSENVQSWVRGSCDKRLERHQVREDDALLNAIAEELNKRLWVTGRSLRAKLKIEEDAFKRSIELLWPRYVTARGGKLGDEYCLTLPALLHLEQTKKWRGHFLPAILLVITLLRQKFEANPDVESFQTRELRAVGVDADKLELSENLIRIASLGEDLGNGVWTVPPDIETLKTLKSEPDFRRYLGTSSTVPRPWPTAPLLRFGTANDEDDYKPDLPMRNLSASPIRIERDSGITVLEKLDIGAFADVWQGKDKLGRLVAIKFVRPSMESEASPMDHARALARAAHPNVVTLFTVERIPNPETGAEQDAIVMEFLKGDTLEARLATGFTKAQVAEYTHGLISGIEHIHANGLAHGDLHEANIMLTPYGLKIIDILYKDTLAVLGTSTREQRLRADLRRAVDHIRTLLERSDLPPSSALEFQTALGGPVASVEQVRSALNQVLSNSVFSHPPELASAPGAASEPLDDVSALVPVKNGDDIGSTDTLSIGTGDRVQWRTPTGAFAFLKFRPIESLPTMTQYQVMAHIESSKYRVPYIGRARGFNYSYSKFGGTLFANVKDNSGQDYAEEVSILYPDGQLLLLDGSFMQPGGRQRVWDPIELEQRFTQRTQQTLRFYDDCFDSPTLEVAIGLCGLSESVLVLPQRWYRQTSGPTYILEIGHRWLVQDSDQLGSEIEEFFKVVWQHYGLERPTMQ